MYDARLRGRTARSSRSGGCAAFGRFTESPTPNTHSASVTRPTDRLSRGRCATVTRPTDRPSRPIPPQSHTGNGSSAKRRCVHTEAVGIDADGTAGQPSRRHLCFQGRTYRRGEQSRDFCADDRAGKPQGSTLHRRQQNEDVCYSSNVVRRPCRRRRRQDAWCGPGPNGLAARRERSR